MTKQRLIWFANYIRTAPLSDVEKNHLATMVIAAATRFNGKFRSTTFLEAAGLAPRS